MSDALKYGNRNVPKMIREWDAHRQACRAEGTPLIQSTLDAMEEHIDFAYRALPATDARADALREAALDALASLDMARDKLTALIDKPAPDAREARQAAAQLLLDMLHMKNGAHEGVTKDDAQAMWEAASTREGYAAVDAFLRSIIGEAKP